MIQQKVLSLSPKFYVLINGVQVVEIVKKFSLFRAKYYISGPEWEVKGKILEHDYTFTKQGEEIVHVHKAWLSWGDSYELDIADQADTTLVLAAVLAIDCVLEAQEEAREMSE